MRSRFGALTTAWNRKRARKMVALFLKRIAFVLSISVLPMRSKATALWRWSNYLQSRDVPGRPQVLIYIDETNVKLVPQERKGHVSERAYRLTGRSGTISLNHSIT